MLPNDDNRIIINYILVSSIFFPHVKDGIFLPYENVLNYESFAVRIREDEIPNLINILRVIFFFNIWYLETSNWKLAALSRLIF